jgi:cation transport ATPase
MHPMARAIVAEALGRGIAATAQRDLQAQLGFGVVASVDGERTILERRALLEALSLAVLGAFSFRDLRVDRCSPACGRDAVRDRCRSSARSLVVWPIATPEQATIDAAIAAVR